MSDSHRKTYVIEVMTGLRVQRRQATIADVQAERAAVERAYDGFVTRAKRLRRADPELVIHPKRPGATMPIILIETLASLRKVVRSIKGVKSVTLVDQPIRRIG